MAAVDIVIQAKNKVSAGLSKAGASLKKFGDKAKRIGKAVGGAFKLISAGVLAAGASLLTLGGFAVKASAAAGEMRSKFTVVFGDLAAGAEEFASKLGESTNRGKHELMGFMASLQDLFVPMGLSNGAANDLSEKMTKLAVDVASFNNVSDAKVIEDFQAAMTGSGEVMKKYGVVLTEAKIKQKAVELGLAEQGETITDVMKVQARYQIILEGTTAAQGDAERTSGSLTNQYKGFKAALQEAAISIGDQIIANGNLAELLGKVTAKVKELTAKFADWAESGGIEKVIAGIKIFIVDFKARMQNAKDLFQGFADSVGENAFYAFDKMRVAIINAFSSVKTAVENVAYNAAAAFFNMVDDIKGSTAERLEFKGLQDGLAEADKSMAESSTSLEKAYDKIIARDKETADKIKAINDKLDSDLKKKAEARAKAEREARKKYLEGVKSDAEEVVKVTDVITDATYDLGDAIEGATENAAKLGKTFATDFEIDKFVNSVKRLANGLKDIPEVKSLAWLKDLGKIKISRISPTAVSKFVHSIKMLADGLKDIPYVNIGSLKDLGDIKLSKLSGFEVKKFTAAMRSLSSGLDGVTLPDLSMGLERGDIDKMTKLAESLSKVKGGTVKIAFTDTISKAIVQNEVNTASIKSNLEKLLVVK